MRSTLIAAALVAVSLAGCYTPEGGWYPYSGGATTYYSYETRPVSVKLVDLRSGEVVFAMDVPAGRQLTCDFLRGKGDDPALRPDLMRYEVWPIGTTTGSLTNSLTVPSQTSRRMDVTFRDGVEFAAAPADEVIRTDTPEDRPAWWTPEGGQQPADRRGVTKYDE
jgi:hypothetical protein